MLSWESSAKRFWTQLDAKPKLVFQLDASFFLKIIETESVSRRGLTVPRTCLVCSSPQREAIDKALVAREPLRNISKRVSISPAGLLRHRSHVASAIRKAHDQDEGRLGETMLDEMRRVQRKAWELLAKMESEGDHRGSIVALREVRVCIGTLGEMLATAETANKGTAQEEKFDFSVLTDEELSAIEALLAKAQRRSAWKPELLTPETLARIAKG